MTPYNMPICIQHQKEMNRALNRTLVAIAVALIFAFFAGFAFCKIVGGSP